MINSLASLTVPSQAVVGAFIAGLAILLTVIQITDPGAPALRSLKVFSRPLLAMFIIVMIVRVIHSIRG